MSHARRTPRYTQPIPLRSSHAAMLDRARREVLDMRRRAQVAPDFLELARRWGNAIECNDAYTQGHCDRVADLSCALAAADGMDEESMFWFRVGALLHDVGKIAVPTELLNKVGALTAEEWAVVRGHPLAGVDLVRGIRFPTEVMDVLQSHHERWDGTGYPNGLAGESIPRGARIVCIADAYDALTSERSYKPALGHEQALAMMRTDSGRHFDPALLARFERVVAVWTGRAAPL